MRFGEFMQVENGETTQLVKENAASGKEGQLWAASLQEHSSMLEAANVTDAVLNDPQEASSFVSMKQHARLLKTHLLRRQQQQTKNSNHHLRTRQLQQRSIIIKKKIRSSWMRYRPSKIPIRTCRIQARAAIRKATSDLADAIAMIHLSSSVQNAEHKM